MRSKLIISLFGLAFGIAFLMPDLLYAQKAFIRVLNKKSGDAVIYANVCFESLDGKTVSHKVTDDQGKAENPVKSISTVAISFVGFHVYRDTIRPGESPTYYLEPAILNMEEVVVTGQYTPERTDKSIYKVQVIDASQIQSQNAVNLEEMLSTQLNIKISHDAALGSKMKLQGIGGENVKILVDGVPVIGRMNGDIDLSQISLTNIERIELVEGPMSVNYGTNALAGVINLITRDHVNNSVDAYINTYAESVGQYNVDGNVGFHKNKNTIIATGGYTFFEGFSTYDSSRYQQWKPKRQYFGELKYKRKIGQTNLRISTKYFDEFVLDKGNPRLDADTSLGVYYYSARDGYYYTKRFDANGSLTGIIGNNQYIDVMAAYSWYSRERETKIKNLSTLDEAFSQSPADFDTTSFDQWTVRGTISRYTMDTVRFNYQVGFDINLESGTGKKIEGGEASIQDYALFASIKWQPVSSLSIQPGLRYSYNTQYNAPLTPSVNVKYEASNNILFRASYGRGFRAPSLKELYLDFVDLNHKIFGSDSLKAETSDSYHLSMTYFRETEKVAFKIEPDVFYNNMKDKIDLVPKTVVGENNDTTEIWIYSNVDLFRTVGGRLNITYRHKGIFDFGAGLAYIGTYNQYNETASELEQFHYYPEIVLTAKYQNRRSGINLNVIYKYTGEVTRNRISTSDEIVPYTEESYNMLDVSLSRSFFDNKLNLAIGGKNLFDVTDIKTSGGAGGGVHGGGGSSMPVAWGRSFFASLRFNISK
jgi:outer membrane receptor for ferrienterochelin and colicins